MILVKTPFRVSFLGGGSDLRSFYDRDYGAVVSATIDKYMYIMIHPYFHNKIRIKYSRLEDVDSVRKIDHPIVRVCLKQLRVKRGVEIASIADVPAGTGLGSSSSFTVCLLHALYTYKGKFVTKEKLAQEACKIEIDILKEPIGKQDQYAASYGGLNYIKFNSDETVFVEPIICTPTIKRTLESNLLMFYVGGERKANKILNKQKESMRQAVKHAIVKKMVMLAEDMYRSLTKGSIKNFGEILHEGWLLKKQLVNTITSPAFDEYYEKALKAGARGGKLLGAGGGGFLLFYCEPKYQSRVRGSLNLRELKFRFDNEGSKIIYMSA
jgi:D-glycero-alpha-D-manno-heptose-7-phosphate kinase